MLTGLSLLFVGAVLSLNGIWMLGRIGDRESAVINLVTAAITIAVAASIALGANATLLTVKAHRPDPAVQLHLSLGRCQPHLWL
jgi:hypothetical protein